MEQKREVAISLIKNNIQQQYEYLSIDEIGECFDIALADYLRLSYPSENGRPTLETLEFDFLCTTWITARMKDILDRSVGLNVSSYRENGLSYDFGGATYINPALVQMILPKAGIPK